jgi:tetratricopeptide (TPR) repeat protein
MTATLPVLTCRAYADAAEGSLLNRRIRLAEQQLQNAIAEDYLDPEPRRRLAQISLALWRDSRDSADFDRAVQRQQEALTNDPASPHDHRLLGEMFLEKFQKDRDSDAARQAVEWLTKASKRYPNHAPTQAALARAYEAAGDRDHSREAAKKAVRLDALNRELGHYDRLLPNSDLPGLKVLAD